jgi:hypothetical protein
MFELPRDAPGSAAEGRNGLPLQAICPNEHTRLIPFHFLQTAASDTTPLYGRPFKCPACGSPEVRLFVIESRAELASVHESLS